MVANDQPEDPRASLLLTSVRGQSFAKIHVGLFSSVHLVL